MTEKAEAMCSLYRFYDAKGTLLYVGITGNLPTRTTHHGIKQPWWQTVASSTVEHFPDRAAARAAEQAAIDAEGPLHNVHRSVGKTPLHSFRVEDELWEAAKQRAEQRGETLADALRKFLRRYTR